MALEDSSEKTEREVKKTQPVSRVNLYFSTFIVYVGAFAIGNVFSWTSPSLPKLEATDSWLPLTTEQASWVGSLSSLGAGLSPFLGGWLVDRMGRRPTMILSVVFGVVSWIILYPAKSVLVIYISRFVGGVGGGIAFMSLPLYVGEIAEDSVRSALTSLFNFSFTAGLVLEYIVGPYVSFYTLILASCVAPFLFFVFSSSVPESPYYLLLKDKQLEAFVHLSWVRKGHKDKTVFEELSKVEEFITQAARNKGTFLDLVRIPSNRSALLVSCGCVAFQQLCGINVTLFYAQTIFQLAGQSTLGDSESTIMVGVILLAAAGVGVPLTHRFGIRIMLAASAAGMSVFLVLLGAYLFLHQQGYDTSTYNWLPIASLIGYVIVYSSGFGPGPWAVVAEVFPPNVKGKASAVAVSCCWIVCFILTKLFPFVVDAWGLFVVFWAFAVFSMLGCLFVLALLPDTRGLSLQQIQAMFGHRPDLEAAEHSAATVAVS